VGGPSNKIKGLKMHWVYTRGHWWGGGGKETMGTILFVQTRKLGHLPNGKMRGGERKWAGAAHFN